MDHIGTMLGPDSTVMNNVGTSRDQTGTRQTRNIQGLVDKDHIGTRQTRTI